MRPYISYLYEIRGKRKSMYNPAADSIVETVRKLNEMTRRARAGEPAVDDYLRALASDPVTEWFTVLLREKTEQLEKERERTDHLAGACRRWFSEASTRLAENHGSAAEAGLANVLRELSIIEP
jgi:hypothetical protein